MKKITKQGDINVPAMIKDMDLKKMTKEQLVDVVEKFVMPMANPAAYKEMVKSSMPDLVKELDNKETMGQAMMQSGEEFMLAVAETLRKYNNFTDGQISQFLRDLQGNLSVVEKIEEGGLSMLSDNSMKHIVNMVKSEGVEKVLANIAKIRYEKERMWRSNLEHPQALQGSSIERQLQKPGK